MKKILFILVCLLFSSCYKTGIVDCEWEIIYPDTTIVYHEKIEYIALCENECDKVVVHSSRGSNYLNVVNSDKIECSEPTSSTCPIRVLRYEFEK